MFATASVSGSQPGIPLSLSIARNRTAVFSISVFAADGVTPLDLTAKSVTFSAYLPGTAFTVAKTLTNTSPATQGIATLQIEPADTVVLDANVQFELDCQFSLTASGENYDLAGGVLTVVPIHGASFPVIP